MVDKMMRIAARNEANVSKPIEVDDAGNLKISDKELQRISKKGANLLLDYYYKGSEVIAFAQGFKSGTGTLTKQKSFVELAVSGNATNAAEITLESSELIDLTGIDFLSFDIEETPNVNYNGTIVLTLGTKKMISEQSGGVLRVPFELTKGSAPRLKTLTLNTATINQSVYVRIHLKDGSVAADVSTKVKIFSITGERYNAPKLTVTSETPATPESNILTVNDMTGAPVELTAAKDPEGKAALRIIDAAPYGYDNATKSIRTTQPDNIGITSLTGETTSLANDSIFETDIFETGAIKNLKVSIDANQVSSPLEVYANYYMSDYTTKVKVAQIINEAGDVDYKGTAITFKPEGAFVSLSIKNKSSTSRTFKYETYGGY